MNNLNLFHNVSHRASNRIPVEEPDKKDPIQTEKDPKSAALMRALQELSLCTPDSVGRASDVLSGKNFTVASLKDLLVLQEASSTERDEKFAAELSVQQKQVMKEIYQLLLHRKGLG